jgi:membrane-bound ClpP family serine protease
MWIFTGVLLGLVVLATFIGFHSGPHTHVLAGAVGLAAAGCLAYMVAARPGPVLWSLLGADLIVGTGIGVLGWKGLTHSPEDTGGSPSSSLEGEHGIAMSQLAPEGIVRVRGELWSAISINGTVPVSTPVQVVRAAGVRVEVWGEDAEMTSAGRLFDLCEDATMEGYQ